MTGRGDGLLNGLRVIDLSSGIAGPMTTMMLADQGAQVTVIEQPGGASDRQSTGYRVWRRGTRSAEIDLQTHEGLDVVRRLISRADVVVDSMTPGAMAELGLDWATAARSNPKLISCSITGYGTTRHAARPAIDALVQARTGLLYDQKGRLGTPMSYIAGQLPSPEIGPPSGMIRGADRDGPAFSRTSWPSLGAAYLASLGVAAALYARHRNGHGQHVHTSLLQGALAAVALNWQRVEHPDQTLYWMWPLDSRAIEGLFECADGRWVHHWPIRPAWVSESAAGGTLIPAPLVPDDRLGMEIGDLLVGSVLYADMVEAFAKFPSSDWVQAASASLAGVALVRSPAEALADPSFLKDGCVVRIDDPEVGPIRCVGPVLEFPAIPGWVRGACPAVGEHTDTVLAEAAAAEASPAAPPPEPTGRLAAPLEGVRVLDFGLGVAGPFAPKLLADLGADVIKVNAVYDSFWTGTHMGLGTNRGKRSIALDLKAPESKDILARLLSTADIVATNWRPGAAARLGLDYASLHQRYPQMVVCNSRGYESGPRSDLPGTDQTAAALTGMEYEDGACRTGNPPMWSRSNMGDTGNGFLSAIGIVHALSDRERTGEGIEVSTSIVNAGLLATSYAWIDDDENACNYDTVDAGQYGTSPRFRLYQAADAWIFLAATSDDDWSTTCRLLLPRRPDGLTDDELVPLLVEAIAARNATNVFDSLDIAGVPVEIVDEDFCRRIFDDDELVSRQWVAKTTTGGVGSFEDPGLLVDLSATPGIIQRGPSRAGQHSREVLLELGYDGDAVEAFIGSGVVLVEPS